MNIVRAIGNRRERRKSRELLDLGLVRLPNPGGRKGHHLTETVETMPKPKKRRRKRARP